MAATPLETIYWLDDYSDEVVPCDCTLQAWADWLSKPDEDWNRAEPAKDGDEFNASTLTVFPDLTARRRNGEWIATTPIPEGANFFAQRWGAGQGWDVETIADTFDGLNQALNDVSSSENNYTVTDIACGKDGPRVRIRYALTAEGPRCTVIGEVQ